MIQGSGGALQEQQVHSALERVFARPEFADEQPSALLELLTSFVEWLDELFGGGPDLSADEAASAAEYMLWAGGIVAVIALIWALITVGRPAWLARRAKHGQSQAEAEVERRVEALRRAAHEAEQLHDWTRALRLHFFATVVGLGDDGQLDYRDAWTNRELLERGEPSEFARQSLTPLVEELDEHSFGLRPTVQDDVRRFSQVCEGLLGGPAA